MRLEAKPYYYFIRGSSLNIISDEARAFLLFKAHSS
jgi:hypothetical protein